MTTTGSGAAIGLRATQGLSVGTIDSAGTTTLNGAEGAITVDYLASADSIIADGQSVLVRDGDATLDFQSLIATAGDAVVSTGEGNIIVRQGNASGLMSLDTPSGNIELGDVRAAAIGLAAQGHIQLDGPVIANGAINSTSGLTTTIAGNVTATDITLTSGDIVIGSGAHVGAAGTTNSLHLINGNNGSRTFVGGDAVTTGYSISAAEMLRLFSNNITLTAPRAQTQGGATIGTTRPPDLTIGAFTLQGGNTSGGNLGAAGTLLIETPGFARVNGAAVLANASAQNTLFVRAGSELQVILGSGSLAVNGANGAAGTLRLGAEDVVVATASAISDVSALTTTSAIDKRLSTNDGAASDVGALSANAIRIDAATNVLIQNSGTSDAYKDRRGFTTGTGGIAIFMTNGDARIVVNGRVANGLGGYLTGRDAFAGFSINEQSISSRSANSVSGIDPQSTINGCAIASPALCVDVIFNTVIQENPLVDQHDQESQGPNNSAGDPFNSLITVDLRDPAPLPNQPLIDEPVTGSGNDDLWMPSGCAANSAGASSEAC